MHLVLDTNQYIFTFGPEPDAYCVRLLNGLRAHPAKYRISICRPLLEEIERNLPPREIGLVYGFLRTMNAQIDERWSVPFEFVERYLEAGLKRGDAYIAGYTEWVGADCLISENRKDFVGNPHLFPFKVRTAADFVGMFRV